MPLDLRDPGFIVWLRTLEPREELVVRTAMRERFAEVRGNRAFTERVNSLWERVNPLGDDGIMASVLTEARNIAKEIEKQFGGAPAETKTRERIRRKSR